MSKLRAKHPGEVFWFFFAKKNILPSLTLALSMKIDARRLSAFLANPGATNAVLLYGDDAGLIRSRGNDLTRAIAGSLDDPFRVTALERETHNRLTEETTALSMIGGRRVVRVRDVTDALVVPVKRHVETGSDTLLILEAPDLAVRSKLRTLLEAAANGAAIGCYPEEGRALADTIQQTLAAHQVSIDADALAALQLLLGADQGQTRSEVEKLALYAGAHQRIDLDAVAACIPDSAALTADEALYAATTGDVARTDRAIAIARAEGLAPVGLIRAALIHMQRLHRARLAMQAGASASEAAGGLRPPIFFKRMPPFTRSLSLWTLPAIEEALAHLFAAEAACKRTGAPDDAISEAAILRIAARTATVIRKRAA
jgi:DNA polymerase-3 subunit delta